MIWAALAVISLTNSLVCCSSNPSTALYSAAALITDGAKYCDLNLPVSIALNNSLFKDGLFTNDLKKSRIALKNLLTFSPNVLAGSLPTLKSPKSSAILSLACLSVALEYSIFLPLSLSINVPVLALNSSINAFCSAGDNIPLKIPSNIS